MGVVFLVVRFLPFVSSSPALAILEQLRRIREADPLAHRYTMLKTSLFPNQPEGKKLNAGQHLLASATSGASLPLLLHLLLY